MYIVTGGAGFIGSNIVRALNDAGHTDIIVVDDLTKGHKFENLVGSKITDYQDYQDFLVEIHHHCNDYSFPLFPKKIKAIFHQGACSDTTEWNGQYIMRNNYNYSKSLLNYCSEYKIPFIYASSAAVYGGSKNFKEFCSNENPLNVYGYSKWLFDRHVLSVLPSIKTQVVGLRYFNVYGPYETHKGQMASVAFHLMNQLRENGVIKLFEGTDGYSDGEQRRDFVFVEDVVKANLWFKKNSGVSGIFNLGTGQSRQFKEVAETLIKLHGGGKIEYIPFPSHLKGFYQSFTEADTTCLRNSGYKDDFHSLEDGLQKYYQWYFSRV